MRLPSPNNFSEIKSYPTYGVFSSDKRDFLPNILKSGQIPDLRLPKPQKQSYLGGKKYFRTIGNNKKKLTRNVYLFIMCIYAQVPICIYINTD